MTIVALALVLVGSAGFLTRALIGPTLADRVVALDGLVATIVAAIVIRSIGDGTTWFLDLAIAVAFIGFVAATAAARFIERRGG